MKKALLIAPLAILALASCNKMEDPQINPEMKSEMSFVPMNYVTKGYALGTTFDDCTYETLHVSPELSYRTMQISSYLHPQNGEEGNYFVDKTYAKGDGMSWWNVKPNGDHDPIYWPVGGTLDFLAYSLSSETKSVKNVNVTWNESNASSQVVLDVPGENSQNDILYASAYGVKAPSSAKDVQMTFNHSQAWIEFQLTGSVDSENKGIVHFNRIELENVYNAGVLTIDNNKGNATAKWDFSAESKKNVEVDNEYTVKLLNKDVQYLDMLIPQQKKTAFVLYYTLGSDDQELSFRFTTDLKTWLMGEKYIYKINVTTSEVTVKPEVTTWKPVQETDVNIY
ncbi:MAG: fimbrillin family protein [Bacteroidales bacterium]|nr:fimbrillin family protein [Candidatus Cacconaster merdequi]